jgi:hypothetical protein
MDRRRLTPIVNPQLDEPPGSARMGERSERGKTMDAFQINAEYRQDQLLDEAQTEALLRTARAGRPAETTTTLRDLHGRIVGLARRFAGPRPAVSARKATV